MHAQSLQLSDSVTPWTVAHQAPLSMGFSRQEHWSGLPCPPPGDLPHPGIKLLSLMSPTLAVGSLPLAPPGKPSNKVSFTECQLGKLGTEIWGLKERF